MLLTDNNHDSAAPESSAKQTRMFCTHPGKTQVKITLRREVQGFAMLLNEMLNEHTKMESNTHFPANMQRFLLLACTILYHLNHRRPTKEQQSLFCCKLWADTAPNLMLSSQQTLPAPLVRAETQDRWDIRQILPSSSEVRAGFLCPAYVRKQPFMQSYFQYLAHSTRPL